MMHHNVRRGNVDLMKRTIPVADIKYPKEANSPSYHPQDLIPKVHPCLFVICHTNISIPQLTYRCCLRIGVAFLESTASYTQSSEKIPKITSVQEYAELETRFRNHYREYKQLGNNLNRQRKFVEAIEAAEADKSAGIASIEYKDVKTKFEQANGASEDKWQNLISMSERYVALHAELVAMKDEMWRAFREDKIVNEIDQNGVVA